MIDWNLAPDGAVELRGLQDGEALKWFNKDGHFFANSKWHKPGFKWQTIATRPTKPKTVKDAVEWSDSKWNAFASDGIAYNHKTKYFSYCDIGDLDEDSWQLVCTREEFEAYVKEQEFTTALSECAKESEGILKSLAEQEGDKWTHTHGGGAKCIVVAEHNKYSWLLTEGGGMVTEYTESLKPIKPTISKAEAWDMCQESHERRVDGLAVISDKIAWVIENHDIT